MLQFLQTFRVGLVVAGSLVAGTASAQSAEPTCVTIKHGFFGSVSDSYVKSGTPDTNYGAAHSMTSSQFSFGATAYALLWFDVSFISPDAEITSATLELTYRAVQGPATVHVYQPVTEWTDSEVTWNNFDGYDPGWLVATFHSGTPATVEIPPLLVFDWILTEVPNYGLVLQQDSGVTEYVSSDSSKQDDRPALTVCYTLPY